MSVFERMQKAQKIIAQTNFVKSGQVKAINNDRNDRNDKIQYEFIPIDQILQAVRKAHAEAGIFITIDQMIYDPLKGHGIFRDGSTKWTKKVGEAVVKVFGADGDSFTTTVPFTVQDNSDKIDNKVLTNIERQTYRLIYAIDEGDGNDPEAIWKEDDIPVTQSQPQMAVPKVKVPPVDPKIMEQEAKNNAEKGKIISDLRFKCMISDELLAIAQKDVRDAGCGMDLTSSNFDRCLKTYLNLEKLRDLKDRIDEADGRR